ncbi:MAG: YIP1 family protein [Pseudomonadales bacterium]
MEENNLEPKDAEQKSDTTGNEAAAQNTVNDTGFDLQRVIEDAKSVLSNPVAFYRGLATKGGFAEPAIFVAVMGAVTGLLMTFFSLFGADRLGTTEIGFLSFIIMPIFAVIGSFVGALIMFVIWKLMGSDYDYETSYRSVAYAMAIYPITAVLGLIPYIGAIVGGLWGMYLIYCATVHTHKIAEKTARTVIGVLAALSIFMQISGEIAARKAEAAAERIGSSFEETIKGLEDLGDLENLEEMSPEEAGRKLGEFFKGMSEGMEEFEKGLEEGSQKGSE